VKVIKSSDYLNFSTGVSMGIPNGVIGTFPYMAP